jgi:hypothetical protein
MLGNSLVAAELAASQEGLSSTELVTCPPIIIKVRIVTYFDTVKPRQTF